MINLYSYPFVLLFRSFFSIQFVMKCEGHEFPSFKLYSSFVVSLQKSREINIEKKEKSIMFQPTNQQTPLKSLF